MRSRLLYLALGLTLAMLTFAGSAAATMPRVVVSGSALLQQDRAFNSWGFNYGEVLTYLDDPGPGKLARIERHFGNARELEANTLRIYVELTQVMRSPTKANEKTLAALEDVFRAAKREGIYLDVTGNLVWRDEFHRRWYERLSEQRRWGVQARFWREVAAVGSDYNSVMSYELTSEPIIVDDPASPWYLGSLGGYDFVQVISRDLDGRSHEQVAEAWVRKLSAAVRSQDERHLVSVGMLNFPNAPAYRAMVPYLDFVTVHDYPTASTLTQALTKLQLWESAGKPVVLGETFMTSLDRETYRDYLIRSNAHLEGQWTFFSGKKPRSFLPTGDLGEDLSRATLEIFLELRSQLMV